MFYFCFVINKSLLFKIFFLCKSILNILRTNTTASTYLGKSVRRVLISYQELALFHQLKVMTSELAYCVIFKFQTTD